MESNKYFRSSLPQAKPRSDLRRYQLVSRPPIKEVIGRKSVATQIGKTPVAVFRQAKYSIYSDRGDAVKIRKDVHENTAHKERQNHAKTNTDADLKNRLSSLQYKRMINEKYTRLLRKKELSKADDAVDIKPALPKSSEKSLAESAESNLQTINFASLSDASSMQLSRRRVEKTITSNMREKYKSSSLDKTKRRQVRGKVPIQVSLPKSDHASVKTEQNHKIGRVSPQYENNKTSSSSKNSGPTKSNWAQREKKSIRVGGKNRTAKSPVTNVVQWAPNTTNTESLRYYEAWIDTTLAATANEIEIAKAPPLESMFSSERENSVPVVLSERFIGRIKIRTRKS